MANAVPGTGAKYVPQALSPLRPLCAQSVAVFGLLAVTDEIDGGFGGDQTHKGEDGERRELHFDEGQ